MTLIFQMSFAGENTVSIQDDYFRLHIDVEIAGYEVIRTQGDYVYYRVSDFTKNIFKNYDRVKYIDHLTWKLDNQCGTAGYLRRIEDPRTYHNMVRYHQLLYEKNIGARIIATFKILHRGSILFSRKISAGR